MMALAPVLERWGERLCKPRLEGRESLLAAARENARPARLHANLFANESKQM